MDSKNGEVNNFCQDYSSDLDDGSHSAEVLLLNYLNEVRQHNSFRAYERYNDNKIESFNNNNNSQKSVLVRSTDNKNNHNNNIINHSNKAPRIRCPSCNASCSIYCSQCCEVLLFLNESKERSNLCKSQKNDCNDITDRKEDNFIYKTRETHSHKCTSVGFDSNMDVTGNPEKSTNSFVSSQNDKDFHLEDDHCIDISNQPQPQQQQEKSWIIESLEQQQLHLFKFPFNIDIWFDDRRTTSTGIQLMTMYQNITKIKKNLSGTSSSSSTVVTSSTSHFRPTHTAEFDSITDDNDQNQQQESFPTDFGVVRLHDHADSSSTQVKNQFSADLNTAKTTSNDRTFVLFPSSSSVPISSVWKQLDTLIVLDCRWNSTQKLIDRAAGLPTVHLDINPSQSYFWRWHNRNPNCVSTIEALYYSAFIVLYEKHCQQQQLLQQNQTKLNHESKNKDGSSELNLPMSSQATSNTITLVHDFNNNGLAKNDDNSTINKRLEEHACNSFGVEDEYKSTLKDRDINIDTHSNTRGKPQTTLATSKMMNEHEIQCDHEFLEQLQVTIMPMMWLFAVQRTIIEQQYQAGNVRLYSKKGDATNDERYQNPPFTHRAKQYNRSLRNRRSSDNKRTQL